MPEKSTACQKIEQQISAMMDGQLSGRERAVVEAHLETCERCRALHANFIRLQRRMESDLARLQPPDYVAAGLKAQIARERERATRTAPASRHLPAVLRPSVALRTLLSWRPFRARRPFRAQRPVLAPRPAFFLRTAAVAAAFFIAMFSSIHLYRLVKTPPSHGPQIAETVVPVELEPIPFEGDIEGYLEQSAIVLTQISNSGALESTERPVFEEEKRLARKLLVESKLVSRQIENKRYSHLRPLIDELEPVLWDVANLEPQRDRESLSLLRETIDRRDVLLKVNLARSTSRPEIRF